MGLTVNVVKLFGRMLLVYRWVFMHRFGRRFNAPQCLSHSLAVSLRSVSALAQFLTDDDQLAVYLFIR
jgi:hypothetical protein